MEINRPEGNSGDEKIVVIVSSFMLTRFGQNNFEWLQSVVDVEDQPWHHDRVIRLNEIENHRFYKKSCRCYRALVNPLAIKGIDYWPEYNARKDISWIELLNELKRFDRIRGKGGYQAKDSFRGSRRSC